MAGLGISFYLDENVDVHLAASLQQAGYDATSAREHGHLRWSDEEQLRYAARNGRSLVSHDVTDFARIHTEFLQRGEAHAGILLVPMRSLSELLARLKTHLEHYTPVEQRNNLLWA